VARQELITPAESKLEQLAATSFLFKNSCSGVVMETSNFVIYKHTAPNGKAYIGQTNNYQARTNRHKWTNNQCRAFANAINKYGWDSFTHHILIDELSLQEANDWESFYIFIYNTLSPNGYNLRSGGNNSTPCEETKRILSERNKGKKHSDESKAKMSLSQKNRLPATEETRKKISLANTGNKKKVTHKLTDSHKAKIGMAHKGKILSEATKEKLRVYHTGKRHSEESKKKMSEASKGRKPNLGIKPSDETKEKMSLSQRARTTKSESGYKGVGFHKRSSKWRAEIKVNQKSIYLGIFANMDDAIYARAQAEIKYWGESCISNIHFTDMVSDKVAISVPEPLTYFAASSIPLSSVQIPDVS
jgi:group I intron endonuclease